MRCVRNLRNDDEGGFGCRRSNKQGAGEDSFYGSITTMKDLEADLTENCVPVEFVVMDIFEYALFLDTRRTMMAEYIRDYYRSLD